jgi:sulfate adenylyltransferase subunit 2
MLAFRDDMARSIGARLLVWRNEPAIAAGTNPVVLDTKRCCGLLKTQALLDALRHYNFDAAFGGARRDEEKSRAKERVFSFRDANHGWDPRNQRLELWRLYNTRLKPGESMRAFPLSNWTELDIWLYIRAESIPLVPLYFASERPVVERDGTLIMVDDDRLPLADDEVVKLRRIRFRTLGCYPLSGAIESEAGTLDEIIAEMQVARTSERHGRLIDTDDTASMERKKREGYF